MVGIKRVNLRPVVRKTLSASYTYWFGGGGVGGGGVNFKRNKYIYLKPVHFNRNLLF